MLELGALVLIRTGRRAGTIGTVSALNVHEAFGRRGTVYEVTPFRDEPTKYNVQYQVQHLQRINK